MANRYSKILLGAIVAMSFGLGTSGFSQTQEDAPVAEKSKKRDPFVALVDPSGKIKNNDQLFPSPPKTPFVLDFSISAILWDAKRPLVLINKKVFSKGAILGDGVVIENINPNSIEINDNGIVSTIKIQKAQK